jgi:hypothetical protein
VSVTLAAQTIGTVPRKKSRAVTVYICPSCIRDPKRKTRSAIVDALLTVAIDALQQP